MTRKDFLTEFLGSLGAIKINWKETTETSISGTAIYDINDPEEIQNFIWHLKETEIPSGNAYKLIKTINKHKLLDIDKITVNREQLKAIYCKEFSNIITQQEFNLN